jgi:hypothetical protein
VYVVDRKWFLQWKRFTISRNVKRGYKYEYTIEHFERENPGRITNERLLKKFDKYLRDDNPEDPTNFVLKSKLREGIDYKLMPLSCWKTL